MSGALLADIGGTNARFALAQPDRAAPQLLPDSVQVFAVADFPSLADAARHYLDRTGATPSHGVFAVAGRVDGDGAVAFVRESGKERLPAPSGLSEAVHQDDRVAVGGSVLVGVEHER